MSKEYKYLLAGLVIGGGIFYVAGRLQPSPEPVIEKQTIIQVSEKENNHRIKGYPVPDQISFAGEEAPVNRPDVYQKLDREMLVNAFWHSSSIMIIKRAKKWLPIIDSILRAQDIPTDFKYLAVAESGLANVISPARAVGFWQILKGTAGDYGLIVNKQIDQRYDPIKSTIAATLYFKESFAKFGNWTMVAASYNLGMYGTRRILKKQKTDFYYDMTMSEEPSRYVFRILALKNMLENQAYFGFEVEEGYELEATYEIKLTSSVSDWHAFAATHNTNYYHLKRLNPWIRDYSMQVRAGQSFDIKIPVNEYKRRERDK